ncbi:hypothetical protein [Methylobacillus sp.]|uniref:hypothetical protein n=1 Tax=Methylobacillus sp. TaxID=56818 RepID=UPI0012C2E091|nr:hypothetical protein [Methylobacillus sp.]MPS48475.1 hypothetical protein [Methylobacillus sp.]
MTQSLMDLINAKKQQIDSSKRPNAKKMPPGRSRWRILPTWRKEGDQFWHDYGQHFIKDITGTTKAVYVCVERTFGRPCDVCAAINSGMKQAGDDALAKAIGEAKAGARVLVNALQTDGQTPTVPEVVELPPSVFEQFINLMQLYLLEGVNVLDLASGFDISVERTGTGLNTKYTVAAVPKSTAIAPDVMTKVQDLDKYVAQENEANRNRALLEVSNVSGLLAPAVGGASGGISALPASTAALLAIDDDIDSIGKVYVDPAAATAVASNIIDAEIVTESASAGQPAAPAATAAAATTTAAAAEDNELNSLLADLNG